MPIYSFHKITFKLKIKYQLGLKEILKRHQAIQFPTWQSALARWDDISEVPFCSALPLCKTLPGCDGPRLTPWGNLFAKLVCSITQVINIVFFGIISTLKCRLLGFSLEIQIQEVRDAAPAGVVQWIECQPLNQRVTNSIPSQGNAWVVGQVPIWRNTRDNHTLTFLSLSFSLFSLLSKNK